ncbi:hypothetical protein evm_014105 [Chilo suppressalis]|nr:hypothetical protein evm_014105 [Chilo suppressalis]
MSYNKNDHHHHHKPINVPTAGAQAFHTDGIGRLGHDPPRVPSADWWMLTTLQCSGLTEEIGLPVPYEYKYEYHHDDAVPVNCGIVAYNEESECSGLEGLPVLNYQDEYHDDGVAPENPGSEGYSGAMPASYDVLASYDISAPCNIPASHNIPAPYNVSATYHMPPPYAPPSYDMATYNMQPPQSQSDTGPPSTRIR